MLKKLISAALAIIIALSVFTVVPAGAYSANYTAGDWDYDIKEDGTAIIIQYRGSDADVTVPAEIDGVAVTEIAKKAFIEAQESLISLTVSEGIQIFDGLYGCTKLKSVKLPESVTEIKGAAFAGCWKLTDVNLPKGLKTIFNNTFNNCSALKSIVIPDEVTTIQYYAFMDCTSLESVSLGKNLVTLENNAFYGCMSLKQIFIPSSVQEIGTKAVGHYAENGRSQTNGIIIKTPAGSAAEQYAKSNRFTCVTTDVDYYIEPSVPTRSPLVVRINNDNDYPVERDEEFDLIYYTVSPQPIGSLSGQIRLDSVDMIYTGNELFLSLEENAALFEGSAEFDIRKDRIDFNVKATSNDPSSYSAFLQKNGMYIQPIIRVSAKLTKACGIYNVYYYVNNIVRNIKGKLLFDGARDFRDSSFGHGMVLLKDGENFSSLDDTPTEPTETTEPTELAQELGYLRGDADGDGEINILDATRIQRYLAGITPESDIDKKAADADLDGSVTILDATRIQRFLADICDLDGKTPSDEPQLPTEAPTEAPTQPPAQPPTEAPTEKPTESGMLPTPVITKVESYNSGAVINWNAVAGAEGYRILIKNGSSWKKLGDTTSASFTHTDAPYDTECVYTVRCISKDGSKYTSDYDKNGYSNTRLKTPTLKKAELMDGFIGISWDKVSGAKAYRVYIKGGEYKSWTWIYDSDINYIDADTWMLNLESNKKYTFTVRCVNEVMGDRLTSGYDAAGVSTKYYDTPYIYGIVNSSQGIELYWSEVAGVSKYRVFEWANDKWNKLFDTTDTALLITGLYSGEYYRFTVRGMDGSGNYLTPYDSFGRMMKWDPNSINNPYYYSIKRITDRVESYAKTLGYSVDNTVEVDPDYAFIYELDSTGCYEGNSWDLETMIIDRCDAMIDYYSKFLRRNGDKPEDYVCSIETEADDNDDIWFYFVIALKAEAK